MSADKEKELNRNSTDYVIGQLTASLETTTKALNSVTERLQMVTMTVETLNSKLNSISDLYSKRIEMLEKSMEELEKKQGRDYVRLNTIEAELKKFVKIDEIDELNETMEDAVKNHADNCAGKASSSSGSEQRVFFIVLSVLTAISTIVALVK